MYRCRGTSVSHGEQVPCLKQIDSRRGARLSVLASVRLQEYRCVSNRLERGQSLAVRLPVRPRQVPLISREKERFSGPPPLGKFWQGYCNSEKRMCGLGARAGAHGSRSIGG